MEENEFTLTVALAEHSKHVQYGLVPNTNGYFADRNYTCAYIHEEVEVMINSRRHYIVSSSSSRHANNFHGHYTG